jgi:hypothetical protein
MVIQSISCVLQSALEQTKVYDHASCRIRLAPHRNLSTIRVPMNAKARLSVNCPTKGMGGLKAKLLAQFEHQGIPMNL